MQVCTRRSRDIFRFCVKQAHFEHCSTSAATSALCARSFHASALQAAKELRTLEEFQSAIEASKNKALIVDLYADWCEPCKELFPRLEKAVDDNGNVDLVKVNVDRQVFQPVMQQLQVNSIPFVLGIVGGSLIDAKVGSVADEELQEFVDKLAKAIDSPSEDAA